MTLEHGDYVIAELMGNERAVRRVWEATDVGAAICLPEEFEDAEAQGYEATTLGFRREWLHKIPASFVRESRRALADYIKGGRIAQPWSELKLELGIDD